MKYRSSAMSALSSCLVIALVGMFSIFTARNTAQAEERCACEGFWWGNIEHVCKKMSTNIEYNEYEGAEVLSCLKYKNNELHYTYEFYVSDDGPAGYDVRYKCGGYSNYLRRSEMITLTEAGYNQCRDDLAEAVDRLGLDPDD